MNNGVNPPQMTNGGAYDRNDPHHKIRFTFWVLTLTHLLIISPDEKWYKETIFVGRMKFASVGTTALGMLLMAAPSFGALVRRNSPYELLLLFSSLLLLLLLLFLLVLLVVLNSLPFVSFNGKEESSLMLEEASLPAGESLTRRLKGGKGGGTKVPKKPTGKGRPTKQPTPPPTAAPTPSPTVTEAPVETVVEVPADAPAEEVPAPDASEEKTEA